MLVVLLLAVVLVLGTITVLLTYRGMLSHTCPRCVEPDGSDGPPVVPILPGLRWLCLSCNDTIPFRAALRRGTDGRFEAPGEERVAERQ
jgi:hypothetical protein